MVLEHSVEKVIGSRVVQNVFSPKQVTSDLTLEDCLEQTVQWVASTKGKEYFVEPLETFMAKWGKSFPDDAFYQDRMNYFLEYAILERPMTGHPHRLTPFMAYIKESSGVKLLAHKNWQSFGDFRHSLFEVVKSGATQIVIRDMLTERLYKVAPKESETLKFMTKKSIFQGYLFVSGTDLYRLGQGLIIHPDRARKQIVKFTKVHRKLPRFTESEILRMISFTNMRFLRMQHVDPAVIYGTISG